MGDWFYLGKFLVIMGLYVLVMEFVIFIVFFKEKKGGSFR